VNEDIQRLVLAAFADLADGHGIFPDRRERIATACLGGLVSQEQEWDHKAAARESVALADALIAELDKPKGER
jgi:hypothetical protein